MSKYQIPYDKARKKMILTKVPELQNRIKALQDKINNTSDIDERKGLKAEIDALKIQINSYRKNDPVREQANDLEEDGAVPAIAGASISTTNIGSSTISTSDGGTEKAPFGNSSIYAPKVGNMMSRKGDIKSKKKKKKVREFVEFYNENEEDHRIDVEKEVKKARKENNAEKAVYYSQLGNTSASTSFEKFKGSWAYEQWKKKNKEAIEKEEQELKRFSYMR